jgi:FkbM family methyltransferase
LRFAGVPCRTHLPHSPNHFTRHIGPFRQSKAFFPGKHSAGTGKESQAGVSFEIEPIMQHASEALLLVQRIFDSGITGCQQTLSIACDRLAVQTGKGGNVSLKLRQLLVGTSTGRWLSSVRDKLELVTAPREQVGTIANDQLALKLLVGLCRPNDIFVDVGAHIGSVIAEVQNHCSSVKIIAFEAIPSKAGKLIDKFPDVVIHCCALSDDEGEAEFFVDLEQSGYSSLAPTPHKSTKIIVDMKRLDDILEGAHLIKIDVEGAELGVLKGAENLISASRPIIMFESGPANILGYSKEGMFEFFARHEYGVFAPNRLAHTGSPMTLSSFLDAHEYPRRTTNYFAVPSEKIQEVRDRARAVRF